MLEPRISDQKLTTFTCFNNLYDFRLVSWACLSPQTSICCTSLKQPSTCRISVGFWWTQWRGIRFRWSFITSSRWRLLSSPWHLGGYSLGCCFIACYTSPRLLISGNFWWKMAKFCCDWCQKMPTNDSWSLFRCQNYLLCPGTRFRPSVTPMRFTSRDHLWPHVC